MEKIIDVENLDFSYKHKEVFKNMNFSITSNSITAIVGGNNSGKSTLIKLLAGVLPSKSIGFKGTLLTRRNSYLYMKKIGLALFDNKHQFLMNNAYNELVFPLENLNISNKTIRKRLNDIRNLLDLEEILEKDIFELTYYERCKLLLGVSIIHRPDIIFLDNLFFRLKEQEAKQIINYLQKIKVKEGITIVFTTVDLNNVLDCDDVILLGDKKVVLQDKPLKLFQYDTILLKYGLELPLMIDMSLKLKIYGLVDDFIYDPEGMVEKLW